MLNERKKKKRKEMRSCDALDGLLRMSIISNKHLELEALYFHQYNRITIFSKERVLFLFIFLLLVVVSSSLLFPLVSVILD